MVQAPAVAGARWKMANCTNVFKAHISIKCKMKYSTKPFSRGIVPMHLNASENMLAGEIFRKKNDTTDFLGGEI